MLISRIDRFQGRIFALGNFPLNKKENKLSRPFAATFSTSLIFVIVNETLRAFRGTIPAPLKRRERARRRVLPLPLLLLPCARRKIFTWSINESFEISKSYFLRISKEAFERTYWEGENISWWTIDYRWINRYRESIVKRDRKKKKKRTIYMDQSEGRSNN